MENIEIKKVKTHTNTFYSARVVKDGYILTVYDDTKELAEERIKKLLVKMED
jgi:hypothetical protein